MGVELSRGLRGNSLLHTMVRATGRDADDGTGSRACDAWFRVLPVAG